MDDLGHNASNTYTRAHIQITQINKAPSQVEQLKTDAWFLLFESELPLFFMI